MLRGAAWRANGGVTRWAVSVGVCQRICANRVREEILVIMARELLRRDYGGDCRRNLLFRMEPLATGLPRNLLLCFAQDIVGEVIGFELWHFTQRFALLLAVWKVV